MAEETSNKKECGGKKEAMLAYGLIQISATVVSAISLAAIALGLCAIKQESKAFNSCVDEVIAEGKPTQQLFASATAARSKAARFFLKGLIA